MLETSGTPCPPDLGSTQEGGRRRWAPSTLHGRAPLAHLHKRGKTGPRIAKVGWEGTGWRGRAPALLVELSAGKEERLRPLSPREWAGVAWRKAAGVGSGCPTLGQRPQHSRCPLHTHMLPPLPGGSWVTLRPFPACPALAHCPTSEFWDSGVKHCTLAPWGQPSCAAHDPEGETDFGDSLA